MSIVIYRRPIMLSLEQKEMTMKLKSHAKLTRSLRILLQVVIGVTVVALLTDFDSFYLMMLPPDIYGIVGLVQAILFIITSIMFLCWIYRSSKNLRSLSEQSMRFTPGWAVGWYFIPLLNLWKPYQVMKEIWNVSHKTENTSLAVVRSWWALWIISNMLNQIAARSSMRAASVNNVSNYYEAAIMYMISDGFDLMLNVVALVMVTRIGIAYSQNFDEPTGVSHGAFDAASAVPVQNP